MTGSRTFSLSKSSLIIMNHDGLQPKSASELETFKNAFMEIKKSPVSGYGCFAVRDLKPDTPILVERELFNASSFSLYKSLDDLTEEQRKAYHRLHGHRKTPAEDIRTAIWNTNNFVVRGKGSVFLLASRFNHACNHRNNVEYSYDHAKKCMAFVTKQDVKAGDELFIRYGNDPIHLFEIWGFQCKCGACPGTGKKNKKASKPVEWYDDHGWTS
ncbi:hypothetical protein GGS21DRAFT_508928 [Xylaria nigripes]|nr:hypothetical protein GGS21DRAFT_508928 [Xylaria nigripes]